MGNQQARSYAPFWEDIILIIIFAFLVVVTTTSFSYVEMTSDAVQNNPSVCNQQNMASGGIMLAKIGSGIAFVFSFILFCWFIYSAQRDYNNPPLLTKSYTGMPGMTGPRWSYGKRYYGKRH